MVFSSLVFFCIIAMLPTFSTNVDFSKAHEVRYDTPVELIKEAKIDPTAARLYTLRPYFRGSRVERILGAVLDCKVQRPKTLTNIDDLSKFDSIDALFLYKDDYQKHMQKLESHAQGQNKDVLVYDRNGLALVVFDTR